MKDDPTISDEHPNGTFVCVDCPEGVVHDRRSKQGPPPKRCALHKAVKVETTRTAAVNKMRERHGRAPIAAKTEAEIAAILDAEAADAEGELERLEEEAREENERATAPPPPEPEPSWLDDSEAQGLLVAKRERELTTGVAYVPEEHGTVEEFLARASDENFPAGPDPIPVDEGAVAIPDVAAVASPGDFAAAAERSAETQAPAAVHLDKESNTSPATDALQAATEAWADDDGPGPVADIPEPDERPEQLPAECVRPGCGMPPAHAQRFCASDWQRVSLEDRGILLGTIVGSEAFEQAVRRVLVKLDP